METRKTLLTVGTLAAVLLAGGTYIATKQADPLVLGMRSKESATKNKPKPPEQNKTQKAKELPPVKANAETPDAVIYQIFKDIEAEDQAAKQADDKDLQTLQSDQESLKAFEEAGNE